MMPRIVSALTFLLAVAGCAAAPGTLSQTRVDTSYRPQDLTYVAGRGDMRVEVVGNPFGTPQATFETSVASYMHGAHFGPRVRFVAQPSDEVVEPYRVRMVFNGPAASNGSMICGANPMAGRPGPEDGAVRLLAAFCRGSSPLTFVSGRLEGAANPGDPAFRDFVRQVTLRLFPPQNPEVRPEPCGPPGC